MTDHLPIFRYHPDPLATGSIVPASEHHDMPGSSCEVCGEQPAMLYQGPFFAVEEVLAICPACIADGRAARDFDGEFTDLEGPEWAEVPEEIKVEVLTRTPGFAGWQQERWFAHCGDAMEFLGRAGSSDLLSYGPEAVEVIKEEKRRFGWPEPGSTDWLWWGAG